MKRQVTLTIPITIDKRNVVKIVKAIPLSNQQLDYLITELKLYKNKHFWEAISQKQQLEEWFIEKYADYLPWVCICIYQKLSEQFIEKHTDKIYWRAISMYQELSEQFIEKHADKLDWYYISRYQKLSPEFVVKHIDKITTDILFNDYFDEYPEPVKLLIKSKRR